MSALRTCVYIFQGNQAQSTSRVGMNRSQYLAKASLHCSIRARALRTINIICGILLKYFSFLTT